MENIGILDPEGKNNNPLTQKPYSDDYKKLAQVWKTFPAYKKAREIIADTIQYQVLLVVADTGSGKTVLVPKFVLHAFNYFNDKPSAVAITFPKQIIAKSSAEFAAKTLDVTVGKEVGYQYKGSPRDAKSADTKLLYATDGTIVARLLKDPELKDFDAVIVDEAHERKVQIDFLLYLLRETLKKRPLFRIVIMSATINADLFETYFTDFDFKKIDISGERKYPIHSIFLTTPVRYQEALDEGFKILSKIVKEDDTTKPGAHDILFFVTSSSEAFEVCRKLQEEQAKQNTHSNTNTGTYCVEVFAGMNPDNQKLAQDRDLYKTKGKYARKVVIATNVAESSLTIDGIKFVIDSGFELKSSYDPDHRAQRLDRKLITNAQAKQRMGRAGRTEPGICYHLYTKNDFDSLMEKFPAPDIRTSDISEECLKLLSFESINSVSKLQEILNDFIEPPTPNFVTTAVNIMKQLGYIENNQISPLGKVAVDVGTDLVSSLAIITAKVYSRERSIGKIVAMMYASRNSLNDLFLTPRGGGDNKKRQALNEKFKKAQKKFRHASGDHLSLLNVYNKFREKQKEFNNHEKLAKWCRDNFLKLQVLTKAKENYNNTKDTLRRLEDKIAALNIEKDPEFEKLTDDDDKILYCLRYAHRINTAVKDDNFYRTAYSGDLKVKINQNSFMSMLKKQPKNVFYTELFILLGRPDLNIVSTMK